MRIVFMGTPDFAVGTMVALAEAGHEIILAVTQPDRPKGRGKKMQASPVKDAAVPLGIEVYQPSRVREPECVEHLRGYEPDIIVVAAFGQILPKEILDIPPYGCVNVHASLLPKYRGAAPIQWSILNGDEATGVTTMRMDEGMDTGDIILQREVQIGPKETGGSLFDRLSREGASLCVQTLERIADGTAVYTPQDDSQATYTKMMKKELGDLDWSRPAVELERRVRGLNPWPSAYTQLRGKTLKIWEAEVLPENADAAPGEVAGSGKEGIRVQTGGGQLLLKEVQLEGKKRMAADAFLRGYPLQPGEVLGRK